MRILCEFVGGRYNGRLISVEIAELATPKRSYCWKQERASGCCCPRQELDHRPVFDGYLSPMWDGLRYEVNGRLYYDFDLTEATKRRLEPIGILRYETQEVYDLMSR